MDLALSKDPIAFVITPSNKLEVKKIKIIHSKFFIMKPWGVFEVDSTKAIPYQKQSVYLYDARSAKPIDFRVLKEIQDFAKNNKLFKIKRKDIRHGASLRKLINIGKNKDEAISELSEKELEAKQKVHDEIQRINEDIAESNKSLLKEGKSPLSIEPDEFAEHVIENLVSKSLITKPEAIALKVKLVKQEITLEEFIYKLEELKTFVVHTPISATAEKFLDDYHTYDPARISAFIDRAESIGEKIRKMGTPDVKNLVPIKYIFMVIFGVVIVAAVVGSMDFENVGDLGASFGGLIPDFSNIGPLNPPKIEP